MRRAADLAVDVSGDAEGVHRTCAALDGLPLAIELAARRSRTLTPSAIADRLDDRFRILAARGRGDVARHATLESMVAWSHDLLDDQQRTLFRRLSVFTGGFTLEAAEAVCGFDPLASADVLDVLAALVDRSLVAIRGERYAMLETLRAFANERLADAGERAVAADSHLRWSADIAERGFNDGILAATEGAEAQALAELSAEAANLQAATAWAIDGDGDPALGLTVAQIFGWLGQEFGAGYGDALGWIDALETRVDDPLLRARGLLAAGNVVGPRSVEYGERAIALAAQHDAGAVIETLGRVLVHSLRVQQLGRAHPNLETTRNELAAAASRLNALGVPRMSAITMAFEATAAYVAGDNEAGLAIAEEGVAHTRRAGSAIVLARCLEHVARGLARLGDVEGALDAAKEAVAVAAAANVIAEEALARGRISRIAAARGDWAECMSQLASTIEKLEESGMWAGLAVARTGAAAAAVVMGEPDLAREHAHELMTALRLLGDLDSAPHRMAGPARAARASGDEALAAELETIAQSR